MYVILLLILCKVESSIERKGEFTEKEEHPIFASFIDCIAEDTNLEYLIQYYLYLQSLYKHILCIVLLKTHILKSNLSKCCYLLINLSPLLLPF